MNNPHNFSELKKNVKHDAGGKSRPVWATDSKIGKNCTFRGKFPQDFDQTVYSTNLKSLFHFQKSPLFPNHIGNELFLHLIQNELPVQ